jgi:hypothetical protein
VTTPPIARTQLIIDWVTSLGWPGQQESGYPLFPGPYILRSPDQAVFITATTGPGAVTEEGLPQAAGFQARLRGPADDAITAESYANLLDQLILAAPFPVIIDGVTINHAHRLGGPPTPLPVDPADLRHEFTASYVIITGV